MRIGTNVEAEVWICLDAEILFYLYFDILGDLFAVSFDYYKKQ